MLTAHEGECFLKTSLLNGLNTLMSTSRNWRSSWKTKLPQEKRGSLLLSPYVLASTPWGSHTARVNRSQLGYFFKGTLWVDHQLYFPQALVRIECV